MSGFSAIDLSKLPAPDAVDVLDVEAILADLKSDLVARDPELVEAVSLESEPIVKLLEVVAYRELLLRQRINEAARATMLAFARGSDLEHIGALFGVERLVVLPAIEDVMPPIPAVLESDLRLRARIQLSLEGFSTAGTFGGYRFFALSASGSISDVAVLNDEPGVVRVVVSSIEGDGSADQDMIAAVDSALNSEEVRPLCDTVVVETAAVLTYEVSAILTFYDGPDAQLVLAAAQAAVLDFVAANRSIGRNVTRAGLIAALYRSGVQNVDLLSPASDLVVGVDEVAYCTAVSVVSGGIDD